MPGMAANLHEHEWREHGGCSGLDDDEYFRRSIDLARGLDVALRAKLTTLAGGEATAAELREMADLYQPGFGATFTLHCRTLSDAPPGLREQAFLFEVRQCVDNDGPGGAPGTLLDCASVQRRDQGCGESFWIAESTDGKRDMSVQLVELAIAYAITAAAMFAGLLVDARGFTRLLALAGVFGHGDGARRRVVEPAAQTRVAGRVGPDASDRDLLRRARALRAGGSRARNIARPTHFAPGIVIPAK